MPTAAERVRPTREGGIYLWTLGFFSAFLLLISDAEQAFLLGALALGFSGAAWALARANLGGLHLERQAPRRTRAGAATPIVWQVRSERRTAALGIEIQDRPARGTKPVRLDVEMPVVRPGETVTCAASVVFPRRGVVDLAQGQTEVASRFPLGIFRAQARVRTGSRIVVRPREGTVVPGLRRRLRGQRPLEARKRMRAGEDVIYGVREYRDGDDPRRIHWRTTARRGAITVSEWRSEQGREVIVVLGRGRGAGGEAGAHFERAVSAAATLWRACAREGLDTRLVLGDGRVRRARGIGRELGKGLDALAQVAPQGNRRPRAALRTLAAEGTSRTVIYVAAGAEAALEHDLAAAAGRGGETVFVRAHTAALTRWVRGLA